MNTFTQTNFTQKELEKFSIVHLQALAVQNPPNLNQRILKPKKMTEYERKYRAIGPGSSFYKFTSKEL